MFIVGRSLDDNGIGQSDSRRHSDIRHEIRHSTLIDLTVFAALSN